MIDKVSLGDKVFYKRHTGRGRPSVAEVIGIITEIRNSDGKIIKVSSDDVTPYVYRPYKRRMEKQTNAKKH